MGSGQITRRWRHLCLRPFSGGNAPCLSVRTQGRQIGMAAACSKTSGAWLPVVAKQRLCNARRCFPSPNGRRQRFAFTPGERGFSLEYSEATAVATTVGIASMHVKMYSGCSHGWHQPGTHLAANLLKRLAQVLQCGKAQNSSVVDGTC